MKTDMITIGDHYYHKDGKYKDVVIKEKTSTSLRFVDEQGFWSWMHIDEFNKNFLQHGKIN